MKKSIVRGLAGIAILAPVIACSGGVASDPGQSSGGSTTSSSSGGSSSGSTSSSSSGGSSSGSTSSSSSGGSSSGGGRVPAKHRAVAMACDGVRNGIAEPPPSATGQCTKHADCTAGKNGRCIAERAGFQCTYDACQTDGECGTGVCECGGGDGESDICLQMPGCKVDADCGAGGYCSPSQGDCGNYFGTIGYFCHQANDECVDDADCAGGSEGSCRFNKQVGHWRCETSQCAG